MIFLLLLLLLCAAVFGGYGHTRGDWGYYGWSPLVVLLLVVVLLVALGYVH